MTRDQIQRWRDALESAAQAPDWREVDRVRYEMDAELANPEAREWRVAHTGGTGTFVMECRERAEAWIRNNGNHTHYERLLRPKFTIEYRTPAGPWKRWKPL